MGGAGGEELNLAYVMKGGDDRTLCVFVARVIVLVALSCYIC